MTTAEQKAMQIVEKINLDSCDLNTEGQGIGLSFGSTGLSFGIVLEGIGLWDDQADSEDDLDIDYIRRTLVEIGESLIKLGKKQ